MPELLGATNPVPGYDNSNVNRNLPVSPGNTQIQNVPDPTRVVRPDGRTEQQDSGTLADSERLRYDSNFQTFLQRLKDAPDLASRLTRLFAGEGMVVLSGLSEGIATEMAQVLEMIHVDPEQLSAFLSSQMKTGTRFGGALMALLRNAYARASSASVRQDILQFLKSYSDHSSTAHIEGNLLRSLRGMADAMPASWGERLRQLSAELENGIAAGDRQGNLQLLRQQVLPHMSSYVTQTHDVGTARSLLTLLTLDIARYENGSEENLLQAFHRLTSYGTLKEQLGGVDDKALLNLLRSSSFSRNSPATAYADHLAAAASLALRGEGDAQTQEIFQQLMQAMLINESVYMPVNHYLIPLEWNGNLLFSELWVDPDAGEKQEGRSSGGGGAMKFLFKIDVQSLGLFDMVLVHRAGEVDLQIACPERVAPFSGQIQQAVSQILTRNGLRPREVAVRKMARPLALTEVFPKIFEGMNSINVKV
ncbi:MAG: hypothetical protein HFF17_00660 [Oscillospiraceae bacterium]|nr:hypothetical protein [Oscillospiraceae bacterium]